MWPTWKDRGTWHRLAPQPALVTQTRLNWTNAWERFWRSPSGQAQLPSVPCATWHACCGRESLGGSLASIQIPECLLRASVCWGLFTANPGAGSAPWDCAAWGHVGKYTLMRFVCLVSVLLYFQQEVRCRGSKTNEARVGSSPSGCFSGESSFWKAYRKVLRELEKWLRGKAIIFGIKWWTCCLYKVE